MSVYFVAQICIEDMDEYKLYLNQCDQVFSKFNGKYLAVDSQPEVLEGEWHYSRSVIIEFPTSEDLKKWYQSYDYQSILKHRLKAGRCDTLIVKGHDAPQ